LVRGPGTHNKDDETMATKTKAAVTAPPAREEGGESPLLDAMSAAIKKMVGRGRDRGYVTVDEINAVLPPEQVSSEQIEDTLAMLSEQGINVVEGEDPGEDAAPPAAAKDAEEEKEEKEEEAEFGSGNIDADSIGRTDDPVRMYLREMGSLGLL